MTSSEEGADMQKIPEDADRRTTRTERALADAREGQRRRSTVAREFPCPLCGHSRANLPDTCLAVECLEPGCGCRHGEGHAIQVTP